MINIKTVPSINYSKEIVKNETKFIVTNHFNGDSSIVSHLIKLIELEVNKLEEGR